MKEKSTVSMGKTMIYVQQPPLRTYFPQGRKRIIEKIWDKLSEIKWRKDAFISPFNKYLLSTYLMTGLCPKYCWYRNKQIELNTCSHGTPTHTSTVCASLSRLTFLNYVFLTHIPKALIWREKYLSGLTLLTCWMDIGRSHIMPITKLAWMTRKDSR